MYFYQNVKPEDVGREEDRYLVKLRSGGMILATRDNGHWYGMWRWLQEEEVLSWAFCK